MFTKLFFYMTGTIFLVLLLLSIYLLISNLGWIGLAFSAAIIITLGYIYERHEHS